MAKIILSVNVIIIVVVISPQPKFKIMTDKMQTVVILFV